MMKSQIRMELIGEQITYFLLTRDEGSRARKAVASLGLRPKLAVAYAIGLVALRNLPRDKKELKKLERRLEQARMRRASKQVSDIDKIRAFHEHIEKLKNSSSSRPRRIFITASSQLSQKNASSFRRCHCGNPVVLGDDFCYNCK